MGDPSLILLERVRGPQPTSYKRILKVQGDVFFFRSECSPEFCSTCFNMLKRARESPDTYLLSPLFPPGHLAKVKLERPGAPIVSYWGMFSQSIGIRGLSNGISVESENSFVVVDQEVKKGLIRGKEKKHFSKLCSISLACLLMCLFLTGIFICDNSIRIYVVLGEL